MQELRDRIAREGHNLGRGILKVDSFINHQVDAHLMMSVARSGPALVQHPPDKGADSRDLGHCPCTDDSLGAGCAGHLRPQDETSDDARGCLSRRGPIPHKGGIC